MEAGAHGEGLKLALVVLMRTPQNHHVECHSAGFEWKFGFSTRSGCLEVRLDRSQHSVTRGHLPGAVPYKSDTASDVAFSIGKKTRGVDQAANPTTRVAVTRKEFDDWVTCATFLRDGRHGSDEMVKTKHGDLLLNPLRQGNIYLKGLLLNESKDGHHASITNKELKYGYNFARGGTNRERQSVATASEESSLIMKIWSEALNERPDLVAKLFDILNHQDIEYADVAGAKQHMTYATAKRIQGHLTGEEFADRWYYSEAEKAQVRCLQSLTLLVALCESEPQLTTICQSVNASRRSSRGLIAALTSSINGVGRFSASGISCPLPRTKSADASARHRRQTCPRLTTSPQWPICSRAVSSPVLRPHG